MELDTRAAVTIVSKRKYNNLFPSLSTQKSDVLLKTYTGEPLPVIRDVSVHVQYKKQAQDLVLTVVAGNGPCLLGRNWLQHLTLNWSQIKAVSQHAEGSLDYLLRVNMGIFFGGAGHHKTIYCLVACWSPRQPKVLQASHSPLRPQECN